MSTLMEALFPQGRPSLVASGSEAEVSACLAALSRDPKAAELLAAGEVVASGEVLASAEDGFWPAPGHWMCAYRPYVVRDGILQIPVKGVLLADLAFTVGNFATGYAYIGRAIERGLADGNVRGFAFIYHTPGGEVRKCFDLAERIAAAGKVKPVVAYAEDFAFSAGYLLAAPAAKLIVTRTGGVGSIGVVTSHVDASASLERQGLKITFIHAGKHKVDGNSANPLPDEVKARMQARMDELMSLFVEAVVRFRGLSEADVRGFEAATFTASEAVENGLADKIGSLDDAVAACAALLTTQSEEDEAMSISQEAHDAAVAKARTEGASTALARISAVAGDPKVKGRELAAVEMAIASPEMSAEAVATFVVKHVPEPAATAPAAPAAGSTAAPPGRLDALVPDPKLTAGGGAGEGGDTPDASAGLAAAVAAEIKLAAR